MVKKPSIFGEDDSSDEDDVRDNKNNLHIFYNVFCRPLEEGK